MPLIASASVHIRLSIYRREIRGVSQNVVANGAARYVSCDQPAKTPLAVHHKIRHGEKAEEEGLQDIRHYQPGVHPQQHQAAYAQQWPHIAW